MSGLVVGYSEIRIAMAGNRSWERIEEDCVLLDAVGELLHRAVEGSELLESDWSLGSHQRADDVVLWGPHPILQLPAKNDCRSWTDNSFARFQSQARQPELLQRLDVVVEEVVEVVGQHEQAVGHPREAALLHH